MVHRGPPQFKKPTRFQTRGSAGFNLHRLTLAASSGAATLPPAPTLDMHSTKSHPSVKRRKLNSEAKLESD